MNVGEDISAKFANMGFVCVCLVVLMHVHCPWEGGGINRLAVPFFFAMSGYFLAQHVDERGWYGRELSKRVKTLLVPLFAWCIIWALITIPLAITLNIRAGRPLTSNLLTGWGALRYLALDITNTPALGPLWYVRCLFLLVSISPLIVWLLRKVGVLTLLVFGGLYCVHFGNGLVNRFLSFGFSLEGLLYFSTGIFLGMKHIPLKISPFAGALLLGVGLLVYWLGWAATSIPLLIIGLWGLMPTRRFPRVLVANTFPVYLMHMFVLLLFGSARISSPMVAVGIGMLAVALSVAIAEAMRRVSPVAVRILYGGR